MCVNAVCPHKKSFVCLATVFLTEGALELQMGTEQKPKWQEVKERVLKKKRNKKLQRYRVSERQGHLEKMFWKWMCNKAKKINKKDGHLQSRHLFSPSWLTLMLLMKTHDQYPTEITQNSLNWIAQAWQIMIT